MAQTISDLVTRLKKPRIFVLGDLILDRYVWGSVSRISPEAPVPVIRLDREEFRLGGAANVARNLAVLGAGVSCGGTVGTDEGGRVLVRLLRADRINASPVVRDALKPTPVKTRMIAHNQQMLRVDLERPVPIASGAQRRLLAAARREERHADLSIISDYDKGTLPSDLCRRFIRNARGPVLVGLKSRDYLKYTHATGASLNRIELAAVTGDNNVDRAARRVLRKLKTKFLMVTLGELGTRVYTAGEAPITLPTAARQVYDVTGAGDTALAAFGLGYASGFTLGECALLASAAAGVVVGKVGTEVVSREELRAGETGEGGHRKIVPLRGLIPALRTVRARRQRVVFTHGSFDLLHTGHLQLLRHARSRGDVLVVGLRTDRSVRLLQGPGRPLLPQADRALLLASLEMVDYVVLFDQRAPATLVGLLRPDVLLQGEDEEDLRGTTARHAGCTVEAAPVRGGMSTAELIRRIRAGAPASQGASGRT